MCVNLCVNSQHPASLIFSKTAAKVAINSKIRKNNAQNVRKSVRRFALYNSNRVMAVSFSIEKRTNKRGEAPVRCSISIQGQRLQTTTKIAVRPEYWDSDSQRILSSTAAGKMVVNSRQMSAKQMNAELKRIDIFFSEYENNLRLNGESVGNLKDIFSRKFGRKTNDTDEEVGTAEKEENAPGAPWQAMKPYIDIVDKAKKDAMSLFDAK